MIKRKLLYVLTVFLFMIQACSHTVLNKGTILKSEAENFKFETSIGKVVEGKVYYPYLIGFNFQESIDEAFENAGLEYDMLVDATIEVTYYYLLVYFSKYVEVKGIAVNSKDLKAKMGEEKFSDWLSSQDVFHRNDNR